MTSPALPVDGQLAWGDPLNAVIINDEGSISALQTSLNSHETNVPPDPHGDRAFTLSITNPITTNVNGPGGYVRNDATGKIPLSCIPVGAGLQNWIDAVPDYQIPINSGGPVDVQLNAALTQTNLNGGGVVYVGDGVFQLANPLVIYPNTWLLCSPGAVFLRYASSPPFSMIQNFATGIVPNNGNIRITGGTWDIASAPGNHGCFFTLANVDFVIIDNLGVVGYPDGRSPIGRLFGCSNVTLDNIEVLAGVPVNSGRSSNNFLPVFQIDELNASNISGIPTTAYAFQPCSDIKIRACTVRCGVFTDSVGNYSGWSSFCGSRGSITSGNIHSNVVVTECFGSAFSVAAVEVLNWSNLTCTGNFFSFPASAYVATWTGISAQVETFIFDTNTPRCYTPAGNNVTIPATCGNTLSETIICQFTVPGNDWLAGSSCYEHRHSGFLSCNGTGETLTLKIYLGPLGTTGDVLIDTIVVTTNVAQSGAPYCHHHHGWDVDSDNHWNPCGSEFRSACISAFIQAHCGTVRYSATPGQQLYITHTAKWSVASSGNTITCRTGFHDRRRV